MQLKLNCPKIIKIVEGKTNSKMLMCCSVTDIDLTDRHNTKKVLV